MSAPGAVRVGTAGWSYSDWKGIVYPQKLAPNAWLEHVARFVDCLEVNVTFYRIPQRRLAEGWLQRTEEHRELEFLVKVWQGFTHQPLDTWEDSEVRAFRDGIAPLVESGRCGALLAQFPWSFHASHDHARHLARLRQIFDDVPLVVEVRHRSWYRDDVFEFLSRRDIAYCNIDQPSSRSSVPPTAVATNGLGYVRLHGRNSGAWFRADAGRDERYDYLYGDDELEEWVERIEKLRGETNRVYVIANNHFQGQAFVNALELRVDLGQPDVRAPEPLLERYPRLLGRGIRGVE